MKNLQALLYSLVNFEHLPDIMITGLALDSRHVRAGDLFLAYKGLRADGRDYISQAIDQGAVAVLCEAENYCSEPTIQSGIPLIPVSHLSHHVSKIVGRFYENPSSNMLVVGITGTNGKSSCAQLLAQALKRFGKKSATIGTLGYGVFGQPLTDVGLTTPNPLAVQTILDDFSHHGVEVVALEASSHALAQKRVADVNFDLGIFTNLTRDHLDYHGSMEAYTAAKRQLFEMPGLRYAVFNMDDSVGRQWYTAYQDRLTVCGYSMTHQIGQCADQMVIARDVQLTPNGLRAWVCTPWGDGVLKSPLLGAFNVSNLLAVIASLGLLGYPFPTVFDVVSRLDTVLGRMQVFDRTDGARVVIDFAHTPDALEQALIELRHHTKRRLFCVFGCGGDRDKGKRSIMGKIAQSVADRVIVTNDNPRFEDATCIIDDILTGVVSPADVFVEEDRGAAILKAWEEAGPGDMILIAGKGHEPYQIIQDQKHAYSDVQTILNLGAKAALGDV